MTQDFIYNMDVLIPIVQLTSNERYFSAGWLNKSVLIQSQKLCCKSFLLPDIRATLSFFSWILFQSLKRRVSKHINLENESVANVFFGTLETPFSTKCNYRKERSLEGLKEFEVRSKMCNFVILIINSLFRLFTWWSWKDVKWFYKQKELRLPQGQCLPQLMKMATFALKYHQGLIRFR